MMLEDHLRVGVCRWEGIDGIDAVSRLLCKSLPVHRYDPFFFFLACMHIYVSIDFDIGQVAVVQWCVERN